MKELSITNARDSLAEILNRAAYAKEWLVLTRYGKRLVAVVPVEDRELLESPPPGMATAEGTLEHHRLRGDTPVGWCPL
jgi:prevent-host-death family protein